VDFAAGTQADSPLSFLDSNLGALPTLETPFLSLPFGRQECLPYNRISPPLRIAIQRRLKYWTAFSCFFAAARVLKVPRFRRLPVFGFFFREYKR